MNKGDPSPLVSFVSCFAGIYNALLYQDDDPSSQTYSSWNTRLEGSMKDPVEVRCVGVFVKTKKLFEGITGKDGRIENAKKDKKPLVINLFIGEHGNLEDINDPKRIYKKTNREVYRPDGDDPKARFSQWPDPKK